ncbi:MAG: amidohydrolase family protein [Bacteroidales bacterium]
MIKISPNPKDRLKPEMIESIKDPKVFFDVHAHIFNYQDVPNGFLGIRLPFNVRFLTKMEHLLHRLINKTDTDKLSNLAYFIEFFRTKTSKETTQKIESYYPGVKLVFCPLMMDMAHGINGKIQDPYNEQIEKMKTIRDEFPHQILPFFAADPNNPEMYDNFIKVFSDEKDYQFNGVKIYPSLGYLPSHPELMKIFEICAEKKIPVTAHCASAIVHASKKTIRNIKGWHYEPGKGFVDTPIDKRFRRKPEYAEFFNHPRNWMPVLEKFPNLKLNLAHFGGDDQWENFMKGAGDSWVSRIIDLMQRFPNVYSDFSCTLHDRSLSLQLKKLITDNALIASRVLYGSDYYMIVKEGHFRSLKINFTTLMGDDIMNMIAVENPKKFLFG